jgi:hypothetical protein
MYAAYRKVAVKLDMIFIMRQGCPNVRALARRFANGNANHERDLVAHTCNKATLPRAKFLEHFQPGGKLFDSIEVYRGLRLLNPYFLTTIGMVAAAVEIERILAGPAFSHRAVQLRAELLLELPAYLAAAESVPEGTALLPWWNNHKVELKTWYGILCVAVVLQPHSCGPERVFSMLDHMFTCEQEGALEDYKETAVLMRYNELKRKGINPEERSRRAQEEVEVVF